MKKVRKALVSFAIAGMALTMASINAFADTGVTTSRLFGSDRVGTAIAIADAGWTTAGTVILAPSADANMVDALAAAPLAGKGMPILLTENDNLNSATHDELIKLGVKQVIVVGAISQTVVNELGKMTGVTATVLKGIDRISTAVAISSKLTAPAGAFVVGYGALADALSVASYAAANNYAILIANPDGSLPKSEAAFTGGTVYIIGGPTLVQSIPGDTTRIYGADRFATNQAVLKALTYKYDTVFVANGKDAHLVDALVASSLEAKTHSPIVLGNTASAVAAPDVHSKLTNNAMITALGGVTVVPDAVVAQVVTGVDTTPKIKWNFGDDEGIYTGEVTNVLNIPSGDGVWIGDDGDKATGTWSDGKASGYGVCTWEQAPWTGDKYEGNWLNDNRSGQGTYTYANGDKYVGNYLNNKMNGQGTYTYANGNIYVGSWLDDKMNGQGTLTSANGTKYVGTWVLGNMIF